MKIESRFGGLLLYESSHATIKLCAEAAAAAKLSLAGACLNRADLSGADLIGADLIDGGQDRRGYRFVAQTRGGIIRIIAGCRHFTVAEARAHWGPGSKSSNAAECLGKVEMIAAEAQRRGWPIESSKTKASA